MATKCHYCGIESELEGVFFKVPRSFSRKFRSACVQCHEKLRAKHFLWLMCYWLGVALVGTTVLFFPHFKELGYFLLNGLLLETFLLLTIIPHELGHAFAGKLVGLRVCAVIVGFGKTLFKTSIMGFSFELKTIPTGGIALLTPRVETHIKLKYAFSVIAGPLISVFICVVLLLAIPRPIWPHRDIGYFQGDLVALIMAYVGQRLLPLQMFFVANALILILNLWPRHIRSITGRIPSDGLRLLKIPFMKRAEIVRLLAMYYVYESSLAYEEKRYEDGRICCEEGLAKYPDNQWLIYNRGVFFLQMEAYLEARRIFYNQTQSNGSDAALDALALNNLAYADIMLGDPELLSEADISSKKAIEKLPWMAAIKGTRGNVLVELGKVEEGIALLKESMRDADRAASKAENACHVALAEKKRGNADEYRRYLEMARSLDPDCFMLKRFPAE